jgi:hypothetical protein
MTPRASAYVFAALLSVVILFQLALALGAPWGAYAMGGAYPGRFPPMLRLAAAVQAVLLALAGLVVLARAGLALPAWRRASRTLVWIVISLEAVGVAMNIATPSGGERALWAPVAVLLLASSLHIALRA